MYDRYVDLRPEWESASYWHLDHDKCLQASCSVRTEIPWDWWRWIGKSQMHVSGCNLQSSQHWYYPMRRLLRPGRRTEKADNWFVIVSIDCDVSRCKTNLWIAKSNARAAMVFSPPDSCSISRKRFIGGIAWYLIPAVYGSLSSLVRHEF